MNEIARIIRKKAESKLNDWVKIRQHLHMHPELSFQEEETQAFICDRLEALGIDYQKGDADLRYVLAVVNPEKSETLALRADIDALPIQEENEHDYKSQVPGVMHACGHDVHTTCLLGALEIIQEIKDVVPYRILGIFQPAEEKLPGGAGLLIKKGILQKYQPKFILGQHVHPPLNTGKIGMKSGPYMASADEIRIKIIGQGGHAALPHQSIDPIHMVGVFIQQIQSIMSRMKDPTIPGVLTFGKIWSKGGATNVIPSVVHLEGTLRCMSDTFREEALEAIERIAKHIGESMGGKIETDILKGYPVLVNHKETTERIRHFAEEFLGPEQVEDLPIRMTAEDFAWYTKELNGCFYRLGTGTSEGPNYNVHHPKFDIDHQALLTGAGFMAYICTQ
jgi:amidohydrolase